MEKNRQNIELLKNAIGKKYNRPIGTVGECSSLAKEITDCVQGEQISTKTIQRLWQQNKKNISIGILNILAKYLGYEDFYSAIEDLQEKESACKYFSHSLSVGKYKLHDAMIIVLNQNNYEMTPQALADSINEQNLYERNDKQPLPASQILLRIKEKKQYFSYDEKSNIVSLNPAHRRPEE